MEPQRRYRPHRRRGKRERERRGPDASSRARGRPRSRAYRRPFALRVAAGLLRARCHVTEPLHRALGLTDQEHDRILRTLGREPNRAEIAMYAAMWSEHCSYKSSKVHLRQLPTEGPVVLVGPGEDAGVVDLGEGLACAFKMESHSHPSAIEPYQGAATGVGGIV